MIVGGTDKGDAIDPPFSLAGAGSVGREERGSGDRGASLVRKRGSAEGGCGGDGVNSVMLLTPAGCVGRRSPERLASSTASISRQQVAAARPAPRRRDQAEG